MVARVCRPVASALNSVAADATRSPSTSAAIVPTRPVPSFTTSAVSCERCDSGSRPRIRTPNHAPPNEQINEMKAMPIELIAHPSDRFDHRVPRPSDSDLPFPLAHGPVTLDVRRLGPVSSLEPEN